MALKMKIGRGEYDKLPDDVKKEYKETGSDYTLDLDGYEDPTELKRAKDNEVKEHNSTKRDRDKYKAEAEELKKNGGDKTAELADLREKMTKEKDDAVAAATARTDKLKSRFQDNEANRIANGIATSVSKVPKLLAPVLRGRVQVEWDKDDNPTTFITGADGKRSAMTEDDLKNEVSTNKEYADIMIATRGSGGGGAPSRHAPGRTGNPSQQHSGDGPQDLSRMNPRDLADHIKTSKENAGS